MLIKPFKFKNRKHGTQSEQWGVRLFQSGTVGTRQLAERISENCTLKVSDVESCLTALSEVMREELSEGKRVVLRDVGSFRIGLKSPTMADISELNLKLDRIGLSVNFTPEGHYAPITPDGKAKRIVRPLTDGVKIERCPGWDDEVERQEKM